MSDNIDTSVEAQQVILEANIRYRKEEVKLKHIGVCHFCEETVEKPKLFCNSDCADDYDKYIIRK